MSRVINRVTIDNLKTVFRALQHRNYRLFFIGQGISLVGTWMQQVALGWLVYRLTNSALLLGIVGFTGQIPALLLTPFGGVIADRYNKHRILIITQTLAMIQAFALAILLVTGSIEIWHIIVLSMFLGLVTSFDMPVRHAFVIEMLEKKEDLGNAIALNSSMFNAARLVGPSIAGIIIAVTGEGVCFLLNAVSYLAVIASLFAMRVIPKKARPQQKHILHELKEGFSYAFGSAPIKAILSSLALMSFMGASYQILMPVFARDIFHGGPQTLGFLMAVIGVGALMGAMYLAARKNVRGLVKIIAVVGAVFGVAVTAFSFSKILWISVIFLLVAGFSMMVQMAASNTVLQTIVEEDKRGRIMSFFTMAFTGTMPFGSLFAGTAADKIGAPRTLFIGGVFCIIGAFIFARKLPALRQKIRHIYVEKGIIPAIPPITS